MNTIRDIDCFMLDMDGTVYLSNNLIEGSREFINKLKAKGKQFVFITNNSSKSSSEYQLKLKKLGISITVEDIINSGEVTASYISEKKSGATIYLVGTPSLEREFKRFNIRVTKDKNDRIDYIVVGFDTTLNYRKIWDAHDLILKGIPYIATHPDYVCPLEDGKTMPDCGAIISLLEASTGKKPFIVGKPNTLMVDYIASKKEIAKTKLAIVGDRLYTDIQTGLNADITSILVLSGETNRKDLEKSGQKPDYILESIKDLVPLI